MGKLRSEIRRYEKRYTEWRMQRAVARSGQGGTEGGDFTPKDDPKDEEPPPDDWIFLSDPEADKILPKLYWHERGAGTKGAFEQPKASLCVEESHLVMSNLNIDPAPVLDRVKARTPRFLQADVRFADALM